MRDIEKFKNDLYRRTTNLRLASHVIWIDFLDEFVAEVVDTFIDGDVIADGFEALTQRVEGYTNLEDIEFNSLYMEDEPGCNFAIYTVECVYGKYQLNFVELTK